MNKQTVWWIAAGIAIALAAAAAAEVIRRALEPPDIETGYPPVKDSTPDRDPAERRPHVAA